MELSFLSSYRSIQAFPAIELPQFVVLTGLNGAGKSHVLQAIAHNHLGITGVVPRYTDLMTRYITGADIGPGQAIQSVSFFANFGRDDLIRSTETAKANLTYSDFENDLRRLNISPEISREVALWSDEEFARGLGVAINSPTVVQFRLAVGQLVGQFASRINEVHRQDILRLARVLGKPAFALVREDFEDRYVPNWGASDLFQQSIGHLFVTYRDLRAENITRRMLNEEDGGQRHVISPAEFSSRYGPPPWDAVNEALKAADLDLEISKPGDLSVTPYTPQLTKRGTDNVIPFTDISSGERIILTFTLMAFQASDGRQVPALPDLLLLDEPDASLHPSMCKAMLNVLRSVMVEKYNMHVIITTHSPSTVALADEGAVFKIEKGKPGLSPCTKSEALNLLTDGVPTLSFDFSGRRQVFVEDESDASVYANLYLKLHRVISAGRSLEFIPTGLRSPSGSTVHSGSSIVTHLVTELEASGNKTVFGLLDWDNVKKSSGRVLVLAEGRRDALENVLFDPLLLAGLICRQYPNEKAIFDLDDQTWDSFRRLNPAELKIVTDKVTWVVFDRQPGKVVTSEYVGGLTLEVDEAWHKMDDHQLTDLILQKLPFLNAIAKPGSGKGAEKLMQSVVDFVIAEQLDFTPIEVPQIFATILTYDTH